MNALATLLAVCLLSLAGTVRAGEITIAAAADLKFALEEVIADFRRLHPGEKVTAIYGSSGKLHAQIRQGAPYDLYFSADIAYPRLLADEGHAASGVVPYAVGRIVLWSAMRDAEGMTLADLADPSIRRIAIANPRHAPYGRRAKEALRAAGIWNTIESRLVTGENVAQAAQFVQTGNADVGIIALALALNRELAAQGGYALIPDKLHQPLEQGFMITRRAAGNALASTFASYMGSPPARRTLARHGFALPGERGAE